MSRSLPAALVATLVSLSAVAPAQANMVPVHNGFSHSQTVPDSHLDKMRGGWKFSKFDMPALVDFNYINRLVLEQTQDINAQINTVVRNGIPVINVTTGGNGGNPLIPDISTQLNNALQTKTSEADANAAASAIQSGLDVASQVTSDNMPNVSVSIPQSTVLRQVSFSAADLQKAQMDPSLFPALTTVLQNNLSNVAYLNQTVLDITIDAAATTAIAVSSNSLNSVMASSALMGLQN